MYIAKNRFLLPKEIVMTSKTIAISIFGFELIAIIMAIGIGLSNGDPFKHFEEFHFMTLFSFFQLLFLAALSHKIFTIRVSKKTKHILRSPGFIWAIIAYGFFFLALDEMFLIHEAIDKIVHIVFNIEETGLTDRMDDIVVFVYGVIGMSILYLHRSELRKYKAALPFLVYGLLVFLIMVILDVLSNRADILAMVFADNSLVDTLRSWLLTVEDSLKIFAEGIFILGLFTALRCAKSNGDVLQGATLQHKNRAEI